MNTEAIQALIASLVDEDVAVERTILELTERRDRIQAAVRPLKALLGVADPPAEFDGGLAEACRAVLKKAKKPLSPVEIRDQLRTIGYDLTKHPNHMASIHSVLKRMAESESKDVKKDESKDGARYCWSGQPESLGQLKSTRPTASSLDLWGKHADALAASGKAVQDAIARSQINPDVLASAAKMLHDAIAKSQFNPDVLASTAKTMQDAIAKSQINPDVLASAAKTMQDAIAKSQINPDVLASAAKTMQDAIAKSQINPDVLASAAKAMEDAIGRGASQAAALERAATEMALESERISKALARLPKF